jgi:2-keto-3-deoxy-L-rhamnonate aldolase RhmA
MKTTIKTRLTNGEVLYGTWHTVCSIEVAEALAALGFDWMAIDMEHGSADVAYAEAAFIAMERHGCAPFVRMPSADPYLARRLLDAGAHGLLVPVVEDAGEFEEFAAHCFYPPEGKRGVALERFNQWGENFDGYLQDFRPVVVPMIETRRGVAAAESIAALPQVDGLFFGPYDLSADLGAPGDFTTAAFAEALEKVKAACRLHGKAAGGHQVAPDPNELGKRVEEGFRLVAYGTDVLAMRQALSGFREIRQGD